MGGKRVTYDMQDNLVFSKGALQTSDTATLMEMISGCHKVEPGLEASDRNGIDYIATLRKGARIFIDAKTRRKGCSKFWTRDTNGRRQPEVALEYWSVMPGGKYGKRMGKVGWTLCETKQTDLILYTFDPEDSRDVFLFSFQLLRMSFRRNCKDWMSSHKVDVQDSGTWQSQAVFVPVSVVFDSVRLVSQATAIPTNEGVRLQYNFNF
jgi:hypothetical protein